MLSSGKCTGKNSSIFSISLSSKWTLNVKNVVGYCIRFMQCTGNGRSSRMPCIVGYSIPSILNEMIKQTKILEFLDTDGSVSTEWPHNSLVSSVSDCKVLQMFSCHYWRPRASKPETELQRWRKVAVQHFGPFIYVITIPSNRTTMVMKSPALHTTLLDK